MQLELGKIYEGKVTGIKDYGAFVEIVGENVTGMVHISQISNEYVSNAKDHLTEGQIVKVKFIGTNDDGKIKLSIKDTLPSEPRKYNPQQRRNNNVNNNNNTNSNNNYSSNSNNNYQKRNNNNYSNNTPNRNNSNYNNNTSNRNNYTKNNDNLFNKKSESERFEDMLNKFKQHSDENLNDLKKITDRRNRSRRK